MVDAEPTIVLPQLTQSVTPRCKYTLSIARRIYVNCLCNEKVTNSSEITIPISSEFGGDMPNTS